MKFKIALLFLAATLSTRAAVLINDDFSYPDGSIETNSDGLWICHSPATPNNDAIVANGRLLIQGDAGHSDDINRTFTTGSSQFYASMIVNVSQLPSTVGGTYFTHFKDDTTSNFLGRVFCTTSNTVVPGTYRLGIANGATTANVIFPLDLATDVDYQIVYVYDTAEGATLWINPASQTDTSVTALDTISGQLSTVIPTAIAYRQSTGEGVEAVDDLLVGESFPDVAPPTTAPTIVIQPFQINAPPNGTNFVGGNVTIASVADGSGVLSYQWRQNGQAISDDGVTIIGSTSNVLVLPSVSSGQAGDYDVVVTGASGSVTSAVYTVFVNAGSAAPVITQQPQNQTNFIGQSATFTTTAIGSGTLFYQWFSNSSPATLLLNQTNTTLVLTNLTLGMSGSSYFCTVSNDVGTRNTDLASLTVLPPIVTNLAFIRSLADPATATLPPEFNNNVPFQVQGVVVSATNMTTIGNVQFYIQDGTGGIAVFIGGLNGTNTPVEGSIVQAIGPIDEFNSLLEITPTNGSPIFTMTILGHTNVIQSTLFTDFGVSNLNATAALEGELVTVTNVTIQGGSDTATFSGTLAVTNQAGQTMPLFVNTHTDVGGKPRPLHYFEITGVLGRFNTNPSQAFGYELTPSRYVDIESVQPPAPAVTIAQTGGAPTLGWTATDGATYSVLSTANLTAPFANQIFGLEFLTPSGSFADTNAAVSAKFYRVSSP